MCVDYVRSKLCPFLAAQPVPSLSAEQIQAATPFKHILQVVLFSREAMNIPHLGTTRLARRVFLKSSKLALTWGDASTCVLKGIVDTLSASHCGTLKSRLGLLDDNEVDCDGSGRAHKRQRSRTRPFTVGSPPFNSPISGQSDQSFYYVPADLDTDEQSENFASPVSVMGDDVDAVVEATRPRPVTASSVESSLAPSPLSGSAPGSRASTSMSHSRSQTSLAPISDSVELTLPDISRLSVDAPTITVTEQPTSTTSGSSVDQVQGSAAATPDFSGSLARDLSTTDVVRFAIGDDESDSNASAQHGKNGRNEKPTAANHDGVGQGGGHENKPNLLSGSVGDDSTDGGPRPSSGPKSIASPPARRLRLTQSGSDTSQSSIDRFDSGIDPDNDQYGKDYCTTCAEIVEAEAEATTAATEASLYEVPLPPLHGLAPPDELVSIHEQPVVSDSCCGLRC